MYDVTIIGAGPAGATLARLIGNNQRHYINIDRGEFDAWLVSLIPSSVDIYCGCVFKSLEVEEKNIKVSFTCNGREYSENTRFLVGADGAFSKVRAQLSPNVRPKVISVIPIGLFQAYIYEKTGSLWPLVIIHILINAPILPRI